MNKTKMPLDNNKNAVQVVSPVGLHERISATGTSVQSTNTYDSGEIVRLYTDDSNVFVSFVEAAVTGATATSFPLALKSPEYFSIPADDVYIYAINGNVDINVCE